MKHLLARLFGSNGLIVQWPYDISTVRGLVSQVIIVSSIIGVLYAVVFLLVWFVL